MSTLINKTSNSNPLQELTTLKSKVTKKVLVKSLAALIAGAAGIAAILFLSTYLKSYGIGILLIAGVVTHEYLREHRRVQALFSRAVVFIDQKIS